MRRHARIFRCVEREKESSCSEDDMATSVTFESRHKNTTIFTQVTSNASAPRSQSRLEMRDSNGSVDEATFKFSLASCVQLSGCENGKVERFGCEKLEALQTWCRRMWSFC